MLDQVNNIDNTNYSIVYYYLMNYHPSTDIIAIAVGNDIFPDYMCSDVLITNSYGIKSQLVRDALEGRINQLSSTQMSSIQTAAQTQSQYESFISELALLRTQINSLSSSKYNYYFNVYGDEIEVNEILTTLAENQNFYSFVSLMLYSFSIGEIGIAQQNFSDALNDAEISELEKENLIKLYDILVIVYDYLGGDYSLLDPAEISKLESIAITDSKSGGIAKSILASEYGYVYEPILLRANTSGMRLQKPIVSSSAFKESMKIVPNPTDGNISIEISENYTYPLMLKVYDLGGRLVLQKILDNLSSIKVDDLGAGFYQATITDVYQKSFNQKLIIK